MGRQGSGRADGPTAPTLFSAGDVRGRVRELGRRLSAAHPEGVVLVAVLKGSLIFLSDLARTLTVPTTIDFLAISTFEPDSGRVRLVKDIETDIAGRSVVLVEDIVDTGLTLGYLMGELGRRDPASLEVCTLLDKTARRILPTPIEFRGFEVPDTFVLVYGLDFAGRYRNLDHLVAGDILLLTADPDVYVEQLYGAAAGRVGPGEPG